MQLKPPNPHHAMNMPNGYTINGYNHLQLANGFLHPNGQATGLSVQQMQSLKSAFTASQDMSVAVTNGAHNSRAAMYMGHVVPNGANYNLLLNLNMNNVVMNIKLPHTRQMQWAAAQTHHVTV
ncbi:hypothetical protein DENSPDRAFT_897954 [Dentipellis sp. KUC8613]|nr:hypothetical protein DENSPDRAFT_897954 [Dentipellis sp. KUC8613]